MADRSCEVPVRTVREWLCDNNNAKLLDEIVPLWPNIGSARQYASDHVPEALRTIVELMRSAKSEDESGFLGGIAPERAEKHPRLARATRSSGGV